jgi:hypothetical protein
MLSNCPQEMTNYELVTKVTILVFSSKFTKMISIFVFVQMAGVYIWKIPHQGEGGKKTLVLGGRNMNKGKTRRGKM